jgi:peptidase C25-like protein/flagellar hook capping protein FlgD
MPIRPPLRAAALLLALPLVLAPAALAESVRQVASDDHGITLELTLSSYGVGKAGEDGRSELIAPGLTAHGSPGRPVLPSATTLLALPPGARPVLGPIEGDMEETREGVRLLLGERRGFIEDPRGLGVVPHAERVEPIRDGPWPSAPVELGVPFTLRGQRMVAVTLHPFRYDEAASRLSVRKRLRVRIGFAGASAGARLGAADDRHWDPVLKGAVLNFEQGRRWRVAPPAAARGGRLGGGSGSLFDRVPDREAGPAGRTGVGLFDEAYPEVRIQLDTTGVYALTYQALVAKGFPTGVPIDQVSVHRHEFVEDATPAYETIELPIEVDEALPANGTFDAGDRIVVFVQSWAERSGATLPQRVWGDGEVIYATRVPRGGRHIEPGVGWLELIGPTPLASYPWTQRWEKNLTYSSFPGVAPAESLYDQFHWTTLIPYYSRPETLLFETNHLDATHDIGFTIAWQGRRNNVAYYTWGQVRNGSLQYSYIADSVLWSGRANYLASTTLPGSALSEGRTNSVVQWARLANLPPHPTTNAFASVGLNWFQATYWRSFRAIQDQLSCNSADQTGTFEVLATGFSDGSALRAYDVTDPGEPRRLTGVRIEPDGAEFALRFQGDATLGRRSYLVFSQPRTVAAARMTAVDRTRPLLTEQSGDYLLIVPEAWRTTVEPLAARRVVDSLEVLISPLEKIYDEFNGGRRSAWAIKRYLRYALNNWNARFVLLAGDGSEDPQKFLVDSGPDIIPVHKLPGPVQVPPDGREIVPSDGWYVWCLNGCIEPGSPGAPPILPELFIGRIPAKTTQELADAVTKLVDYENFTADQTWRNKHLLLSDDMFSSITTFGGGGGGVAYCERFYEDRFRRLNDRIKSVIVDSAGLRRSEVEHFDLGVWLSGEDVDNNVPPCRPDPITTQNNTRSGVTPFLLARLNEGRMWWNYQGHANEFLLAHENVYRNVGGEDDKDRLTNVGKPFLFSAFSCHANAFARIFEARSNLGPPLGEELVLLPGKGAIASWASVGYEIIPDNGADHINTAWARAMFLAPPHDDVLGNGDRGGARAVLGETIALAYLRYITIPAVQNDPTENSLALSYTLLGDPATRISIGVPQSIVTANGDTVIHDRPLALAPPRDSLFLEADLVSNVEIRSIALIEGGAGSTTRIIPDSDYTISPAFPDTVVSGTGGRRYHLSFVTPLRSGVVRYTLRTVDRYGLQNDFNVVFPFATQLRVSDNPLAENDAVTPTADLSLKLVVPTPITDPSPPQVILHVDSLPQSFTATALDTTNRSWILRWTHDPYPAGNHLVEVAALDSLRAAHRFRVVDRLAGGDRMLRDVMAFPNPFDDQVGSAFSYYLLADGPADVLLRVFTVTGRLVYQRVERALPPGYHQWPWDGRDAEGDRLANGVYLYRMVATTGSQSDRFDGRLVKLRRPRRGDTTASPP